ncbi:MAG: M48 family metallopeptidase [Sphingomonadales bacterium]
MTDARSARLFDGQTARPHAVVVARVPGGLRVVGDAVDAVLIWPQLTRSRDGLTIGDRERPDWRLRLDAPLPDDWRQSIAIEGAVTSDDRRRVGMAVAGIAALALALWFGGNAIVGAAAARLPRSVMAPIGSGIVTTLGRACTSPGGNAATAALLRRLGANRAADEPVTLTIIDAPIVNAMALPGGQVVVFDQLISEARSPDELAGVLAHELSHIASRDAERAVVRQLGLSLALQSLGGNIASGADTLLLLSHSREVEAAADDGAIGMLHAAHVATAPTADFFDRQEREDAAAKARPDKGEAADAVSKQLAKLADFTSSHPDNGSRSRRFKAAAVGAVTPALSPAEWQALRGMCAAGRPTPDASPKTPPKPPRTPA